MSQPTPTTALTPAQPEVMHCYRHPDRETLIRCARCDRPICLQCQVRHPVGIRCKECARIRKDPLTNLTFVQYLLAFVSSLGAGIVGGFIAPFIGFSFLAIFIGPAVGAAIAEFVGRVIGYKRGVPLMVIVSACIVAGVIIARFIELSVSVGGIPLTVLTPTKLLPFVVSALVSTALYLIFAIGGVIARLR